MIMNYKIRIPVTVKCYKKADLITNVDLYVKNNFYPNNIFIASLTNIDDYITKEKCKVIYIRKIQQFLFGEVIYTQNQHEYKIDIQAISIIDENQLITFIIHSHCNENSDIYLQSSNDDFPFFGGKTIIIDIDECKMNVELSNKSIFEIAEITFENISALSYDDIFVKVKNNDNEIIDYTEYLKSIQ